MNISWCNTRPSAVMRSDVSIRLATNGETVAIRISPGAMASKFGHAEKICVGFDENNSVLAFAPGNISGFKVKENKDKSATIRVSVAHLEGHVKPHELAGEYYLKKDDMGFYYISIGALCHRS